MFDDTEIIEEFLAESRENLDALDSYLLKIERDPQQTDGVAEVFRTIHTIKGTCGFLGFKNLEQLTHHGETLLGKIRDGELTPTAEIVDALLRTIDCVREILACIDSGQSDDTIQTKSLVRELERLAICEGESDESPDATSSRPPQAIDLNGSQHNSALDDSTTKAELHRFEPNEEPSDRRPATGANPSEEAASDEQSALEKSEALRSGVAAENPEAAPDIKQSKTGETDRSNNASSIRVSTELVDHLMDLVGELVLAKNQLHNCLGREQLNDSKTLNQLSRITNELQDVVVQTRLQPIDRLFQSIPRIVRDVASELRKDVQVQLNGGETEVDRTILDAVRDPLVHLIRNAIDHGIETPEQRRAAGKPDTGSVIVSATSENGYILIDVHDDGRGLNFERIREIAFQRLGFSREQANHLSETELQKLIFHPGFSTATSVTNVSGRGVGMDVVKTNVEKIGGQLSLVTTPGSGTRFRLTVPLTLTIVPSLLVGVSDLKIAIPQSSVCEIVGINSGSSRHRLESVHRSHVLRRNGRIVPVFETKALLDGVPQPTTIDSHYVVIVRSQAREVGLAVTELFESQEVVVKPLGRCLRGLSQFSGVTILGDGSLALTLNPPGLHFKAERQTDSNDQDVLTADEAVEELRQALVVRVADERFLLPAEHVIRLIQVDRDMIQTNRGRPLLPIDGRIVQLINVDGRGLLETEDWPETYPAILVHSGDFIPRFAVAVDEISELAQIPANQVTQQSDVVICGKIASWLDPVSLTSTITEGETCHA